LSSPKESLTILEDISLTSPAIETDSLLAVMESVQPTPEEQPMPDEHSTQEVQYMLEAQPAPEEPPTSEELVIQEELPTPEAQPPLEEQSIPEGQPILETQPMPKEQFTPESQPPPEEQPPPEYQPTPEEQPIPKAQPIPEELLMPEVQPITEAQPEKQPILDVQPILDEQPISEAQPEPEALPEEQSTPVKQLTPDAQPRPEAPAEEQPIPEAHPTLEAPLERQPTPDEQAISEAQPEPEAQPLSRAKAPSPIPESKLQSIPGFQTLNFSSSRFTTNFGANTSDGTKFGSEALEAQPTPKAPSLIPESDLKLIPGFQVPNISSSNFTTDCGANTSENFKFGSKALKAQPISEAPPLAKAHSPIPESDLKSIPILQTTNLSFFNSTTNFGAKIAEGIKFGSKAPEAHPTPEAQPLAQAPSPLPEVQPTLEVRPLFQAPSLLPKAQPKPETQPPFKAPSTLLESDFHTIQGFQTPRFSSFNFTTNFGADTSESIKFEDGPPMPPFFPPLPSTSITCKPPPLPIVTENKEEHIQS
jgi:hypothetical protein